MDSRCSCHRPCSSRTQGPEATKGHPPFNLQGSSGVLAIVQGPGHVPAPHSRESSLIGDAPRYSGHLTLQHQPPPQHTCLSAWPYLPSPPHCTAQPAGWYEITFIHNHSDPRSQRRQQLPRTNRKQDRWLPLPHPQARQPLPLGPFLASEMKPLSG